MLQKDGEDQLDWSCKNEEVLHKVKGERNRLKTIKRKKTLLIGNILRRNCLLKHVSGGKIEVTGTRGRRRKQILDELKKKRGYWNAKDETLDLPSCRTCCERCHVHSVQQKSICLKFSKSRTGSDVRYSCHHNSSRFTFPTFAHSCRFSVFHSLQSITPRIY